MERIFCMILGVTLLAVGIVGSFSGGHDHQLIIFGINATHNAVHILSGLLVLLALRLGRSYVEAFCFGFATIYGAVAIAGFLQVERVMTALNLNAADNWLHLVIAASTLLTGISLVARTGLTSPRHLADQPY